MCVRNGNANRDLHGYHRECETLKPQQLMKLLRDDVCNRAYILYFSIIVDT